MEDRVIWCRTVGAAVDGQGAPKKPSSHQGVLPRGEADGGDANELGKNNEGGGRGMGTWQITAKCESQSADPELTRPSGGHFSGNPEDWVATELGGNWIRRRGCELRSHEVPRMLSRPTDGKVTHESGATTNADRRSSISSR